MQRGWEMSGFKKAQKSEAKARIAVSGPSGAGKTYTSLIWARVLAGAERVAFIDTERGSSRKYSDEFDFDVQLITPPYHPQKLIAALAEAHEAGYPVVVIDSLTHFWSGKGGVLELVDEAKSRFKGNSHAAWQVGTPLQQAMVDAVLMHPGHVIVAMRSKTEWLMQEGSNGKIQPVRVGLAPQQRDGIEYEFDLMLDIDLEHRATVGKTRFARFADRTFAKGDSVAAATTFAEWLSDGVAAPPEPQSAPEPVAPARPEAVTDSGPGATPHEEPSKPVVSERRRDVQKIVRASVYPEGLQKFIAERLEKMRLVGVDGMSPHEFDIFKAEVIREAVIIKQSFDAEQAREPAPVAEVVVPDGQVLIGTTNDGAKLYGEVNGGGVQSQEPVAARVAHKPIDPS